MNTETKNQHGGRRPGAGRPKNPPVLMALPACTDPRAFLLALMGNDQADVKLRIDAAKALMPFTHAKKGDTGKKQERQADARKAATGKFAHSAPPRLVHSKS